MNQAEETTSSGGSKSPPTSDKQMENKSIQRKSKSSPEDIKVTETEDWRGAP